MKNTRLRAWDIQNKYWIEEVCFVVNGAGEISVYDHAIEEWKEAPKDVIDLCQYTGLHDKNDVEIYERDFIEVFSHIYKIFFNDKLACFQMQNMHKDMPDDNGFIMNASCEVIGNICENEELKNK